MSQRSIWQRPVGMTSPKTVSRNPVVDSLMAVPRLPTVLLDLLLSALGQDTRPQLIGVDLAGLCCADEGSIFVMLHPPEQ